jgi:hypothetical protein
MMNNLPLRREPLRGGERRPRQPGGALAGEHLPRQPWCAEGEHLAVGIAVGGIDHRGVDPQGPAGRMHKATAQMVVKLDPHCIRSVERFAIEDIMPEHVDHAGTVEAEGRDLDAIVLHVGARGQQQDLRRDMLEVEVLDLCREIAFLNCLFFRPSPKPSSRTPARDRGCPSRPKTRSPTCPSSRFQAG